MNLEKVLRQACELKQNVMLSGKHGCGKTAVITKIFNEKFGQQGTDWLYFSGSTLDPWVDFVGVPKQLEDKNGPYLELVRPKHVRDANVRAIFIDEYNRAPAKIRNAVMELIQFRSINGHKLPKLEVIWTAINPPDAHETYNVDEIDPAQKDRFPIQIEVDYDVDSEYFKRKFNEAGALACKWWHTLSSAQKDVISPRRLDYATELHLAGFNVRETVIPKSCDPSGFIKAMSSSDPLSRLAAAIKSNNMSEASDILADPGALIQCVPVIEKNMDIMFTVMNDEQRRAVTEKSKKCRQFVTDKVTQKMKEYQEKLPEFFKNNAKDLSIMNYENKHKEFFGFSQKYRPPSREIKDANEKLTLEDSLKETIERYIK